MVQITLSLQRTAEQNASSYFERAKKIRRKIEGALAIVEDTKSKLAKEDISLKKEKQEIGLSRKKQWYEKFRWFHSSEGYLVIGGRDATTNEIILKKHTDECDLVFHTDMAGSPFFVVKTEGNVPGELTMEEAAIATASYSRAWKAGYGEARVFYVKPEQVSKKAQSGEYLAKGAFMIYGKTNYIKNSIGLAVGIREGQLIAGPISAVKSRAERYINVLQGELRPSEAAKKIKKLFGGDIDEIIRLLPPGPVRLETPRV